MNSQELLNTAIVDLDKVIDYVYTEGSVNQTYWNLLDVATKLKTLQTMLEIEGISIPLEIPEVL